MKRADQVLAAWQELAQGPKFDSYVVACPQEHLDELAEAAKSLSLEVPQNLRSAKAISTLVASATSAPKPPKEPKIEAPKIEAKESKAAPGK